MTDFFSDLATPSDYRGQPVEWLAGQIAHAALAALLVHYGAPVVAVLALYAAWETWQGGDLEDAVTDWAFVAVGAMAPASIDAAVIAFLALVAMWAAREA